MKGGKGGLGRKRTPVRPVEKSKGKPRDIAKKGDAKKDWGAIPRDEERPRPKSK
jgi:hypothetical protein